jgi:hypothetical protein
MVDQDADAQALEAREPSIEDLAFLCEKLERAGARYLILGGFAMRASGYDRRTMDIDLLVDVSGDNEARVIAALSQLPDGAASELVPGDIAKYVVIRVADEIVVDVMQSASGFDYDAAKGSIVRHRVGSVDVPFASPSLLLRMKEGSVRDKDRADAAFLRRLVGREGAGRGER